MKKIALIGAILLIGSLVAVKTVSLLNANGYADTASFAFALITCMVGAIVGVLIAKDLV